jgi:hypothetical protein
MTRRRPLKPTGCTTLGIPSDCGWAQEVTDPVFVSQSDEPPERHLTHIQLRNDVRDDAAVYDDLQFLALAGGDVDLWHVSGDAMVRRKCIDGRVGLQSNEASPQTDETCYPLPT